MKTRKVKREDVVIAAKVRSGIIAKADLILYMHLFETLNSLGFPLTFG